MRSTGNPDDLTTRARIRDAAMSLFPEHGFSATTVRQIAKQAGVSPGLVLHHFGSKEGLREACDRHVVARFREIKSDAIDGGMFSSTFLDGAMQESEAMMKYLAWAIARNHPAASDLYDEMLGEAVTVTRKAVDQGYVVGSRDLETRTALQMAMQLGLAVLHDHVERVTGIDLFDEEGVRRATPLLIEIFSGLFDPEVRRRIEETLADDVPAPRS
jgi:TetR/AcrR family transcriptional regulator, regulator of cefoperazone and chloramphenicol sensitivity